MHFTHRSSKTKSSCQPMSATKRPTAHPLTGSSIIVHCAVTVSCNLTRPHIFSLIPLFFRFHSDIDLTSHTSADPGIVLLSLKGIKVMGGPWTRCNTFTDTVTGLKHDQPHKGANLHRCNEGHRCALPKQPEVLPLRRGRVLSLRLYQDPQCTFFL